VAYNFEIGRFLGATKTGRDKNKAQEKRGGIYCCSTFAPARVGLPPGK